jgi:excisionase family DNA binding protein
MLIKIKELSEKWRVSEKSIVNYIRKGKLKALRIGSQWRVSPEEANKFEMKAEEYAHAP